MKSSRLGRNTLKPELANVSEHGFWLLLEGKEFFMTFAQFPWFKQATIEQIADVQLLHGSHLYWPQLDVDLSKKIIEDPDKYKLMAKRS